MKKTISNEYVRGLIDGEGCFTFCSIRFGSIRKKLPAFVLGMSVRDRELVEMVGVTLGLRNKVYQYKPRIRKDGYKRQGTCMLIVRDVGQLKNKIVPFFYKKLHGYKGVQFEQWIEDINTMPDVPKPYKFIYKIYKAGYYEKNQRFL